MTRATSSELAVWRQRIGDREREHRSFGGIEREVFGALEAERWHALDYEARVREMAADRREMRYGVQPIAPGPFWNKRTPYPNEVEW